MVLGNTFRVLFSCYYTDHRLVDWHSLPLNCSATVLHSINNVYHIQLQHHKMDKAFLLIMCYTTS